MKNIIYMLAAVAVFSGALAQAQTQTSKRLVKIDESTGDLVEITQAQQEAAPAPSNPIVILNNQKSTQGSVQSSVQDQPTNVITDSPLTMSAAERRRRDRQALEVHTEQKIVEKLEEARMEDERARSERLFNNGGFAKPTPAPEVQVVQVVKEEPKVDVKQEVRAAIEEMQPKEDPSTFYVQGLVGLGSYRDAVNVKGKSSTGFSIGMVTPERIVAEGTFQYSEFDVEVMDPYTYQQGYGFGYPPFKKLTQYNFGAAVKYQFLAGRVHPVIGAVGSYTYRTYRDQQYYGTPTSSTGSVSTNAFDVGGILGVDVQMTKSFALGLDFRYMKNVSYRENSDYQRSYTYPRVGKAVEEYDYTLTSLAAKFTF